MNNTYYKSPDLEMAEHVLPMMNMVAGDSFYLD